MNLGYVVALFLVATSGFLLIRFLVRIRGKAGLEARRSKLRIAGVFLLLLLVPVQAFVADKVSDTLLIILVAVLLLPGLLLLTLGERSGA